jgi:hypothetical protein
MKLITKLFAILILVASSLQDDIGKIRPAKVWSFVWWIGHQREVPGCARLAARVRAGGNQELDSSVVRFLQVEEHLGRHLKRLTRGEEG